MGTAAKEIDKPHYITFHCCQSPNVKMSSQRDSAIAKLELVGFAPFSSKDTSRKKELRKCCTKDGITGKKMLRGE